MKKSVTKSIILMALFIVMSSNVFGDYSGSVCMSDPYINRPVNAHGKVDAQDLILAMPRLWGDMDISGNANTVTITTVDSFFKTYHKYTDITAKSISVDLETALSSGKLTIAFRYIPTDSLQKSDFISTGFLTVSQTGNVITALVDGKTLVNRQPVSNGFTTNQVVITLDMGTLRLYHNDTWVTLNGSVSASMQSGKIRIGEFPGRIWDILVYDRVLTNSEVDKLAEGAIAWKPVSNPPYPDLPYPISNAYITLWTDSIGLHQPDSEYNRQWEYYAFAQERAYEYYTFTAGMYPHATGLPAYIQSRKKRDLPLPDAGSLVRVFLKQWSWEKQHNVTNGTWWYHENFHSFQGGATGYSAQKWFLEATAEWAPNLIWPGAHSDLNGYYTLHPHFPVWASNVNLFDRSGVSIAGIYGGTEVDKFDGWEFVGAHQYGAGVVIYYILNIAANDPSMMGQIFNANEPNQWAVIQRLLNERGLDLKEVFGDFAARVSIWDFQDGSGPDFAISEQKSLQRMKRAKPDADVHDAKFVAKMDEMGTNGTWTTIPPGRKPGSWGYNAYQVACGSEATVYKVSLKGESSNPDITQLQARVVVVDADGIKNEYYTLPVRDEVARGTGTAEIIVNAQPGDTLILAVATTPDREVNTYKYDYIYDYQYKIEKTSQVDAVAEDTVATQMSAGISMAPVGNALLVNTASYKKVKVILTNRSGKVLMTKQVTGNGVQVDIGGLPRGVYMVNMMAKNGQQILSQKIVKE